MISELNVLSKQSTQWKTFRHFDNKGIIMRKLVVLCEVLTMDALVVEIVSNALLDVFYENIQRKEVIFLLNEIVSGTICGSKK